MATTATAVTEMQATLAVKRPGPPVPPRPKTTATTMTTTAAGATVGAGAAAAAATPCPPLIQKKPTFVSQLSAVGRTLVYKSPSLNLQKKQAQTQTPTMALVGSATATATAAAATATVAPATTITTTTVAAPATAPKPPLKLRKAPAVPTAKPRESVVAVVSVNRANSLSAQSSPTPHKDTRLSLGKVDYERAGLLPTTQPLPKPRKIVQMPVATLDVDDVAAFVAPPATPATSIFRRSKTTLDGPLASQGGGSGGSFLGGKTVELKNNLKNAAERLFSEIIISQSQKQTLADTTIITKHERAIQHQALLEQELAQEQHKRQQMERVRERERAQEQEQLSQVIQAAGNCTRININPSNSQTQTQTQIQPQTKTKPIKTSVSAGNTPEKKPAFHELLISELAAMRNRACSLEQLPTKWQSQDTPTKTMTRQRYNSIEDADTEDVDADNVEDADGDEEDTLTYAVNKSLKDNGNLNGSSTPRKRCPSGCSSDSSPYGTERSQRIRTSDWIEVGDNGKQVTLTSCHISLEDSGMEDEERLDDMSSSGVGDSWDSVKEAERENEKRCRNVKRGMSISGLPPLPKSLSGFNKLLGSDSGLLSDVEVQQELNNNNNNDKKENDSGNKLASQIVSDNNKCKNNNNNNSLSSDKHASKDSSKDNANDKSATATAESATATTTPTATTFNANENKNTLTTTATATAATTATATTTTTTPSSPAKINVTGSTLDAQIATLRKEMYGLRQLDLSLLSQLWALNDSIQEFRTMIEEQEDEDDDGDVDDDDAELDEMGNRRHSPTPSSYDSVSSEGGADAELVMQAKAKRLGTIPKVITTQPKQQLQPRGDLKPLPRMRSAPPPPPPVALMCTARKAAAPPRPT
ncbi:pneumococcal serine-rich repeat protein isoform X1 [Drosophila montana]|uniref:pneumococcal serine-rich repeat protein isoform X1 n=2 Tax=Drosophila montana TaxID=40370 RepID=UPI00313CB7C4